jgi:NTE family protein
MLEALYERGIAPDFLVGTSVGALNAAFVASRPQSPQTARQLGRVWRDLQRQDIFPVSSSALVGGACGRRDLRACPVTPSQGPQPTVTP